LLVVVIHSVSLPLNVFSLVFIPHVSQGTCIPHRPSFGPRDGNGSSLGRVDRKPDMQKNIVGLNLTSEPEPAFEIWHPNLNPLIFGSGLGAHQVL
jgi:hypothetical protein